MVDLSIIPIKNSLANDVKRIEVKKKIIERVKSLGLDLATYKMNNEFLLLILNLVEHLISKKDKIDKKVFVLELLDEMFCLNAEERDNICNNIEFLWVNKAIKKVSYWKLFKAGVCEWFFKKG